jgi:hypothetical protein
MDPFSIALAGGALLGGMAGAQGTKGKNETSSLALSNETELERLARQQQEQGFRDLTRIQREDFGRATQASQNYGNLLQQYQQSGGLPTNQDLASGRSFAEQTLAPQREQIDLAMRQSTEAARQQAALSGRGPNDFAMNTRLAGQRSDLLNQLGAQQSSVGAQYAQQLSQNRLGFAGQFADLQQGLASQAMQNRIAIMGLGSQIQNAGRNFRVATATRTNSTPSEPGSLLSTFTGALGGAQAGAGLFNAFNSGSSNSTNPSSSFTNKLDTQFSQGAQFTMPSSIQSNSPSYSLGANFGTSHSSTFKQSSVPVSSFQIPNQASSQPMQYAPGLNQPWDMQQSVYQSSQNSLPFWQR